jgi:HEPN domain-containing protein
MRDPVRELAHEWLIRAEHDLRVARYLLTMPDPPPESVGFHAQLSIGIDISSGTILLLSPPCTLDCGR